jgi:hypothetical protein
MVYPPLCKIAQTFADFPYGVACRFVPFSDHSVGHEPFLSPPAAVLPQRGWGLKKP